MMVVFHIMEATYSKIQVSKRAQDVHIYKEFFGKQRHYHCFSRTEISSQNFPR